MTIEDLIQHLNKIDKNKKVVFKDSLFNELHDTVDLDIFFEDVEANVIINCF